MIPGLGTILMLQNSLILQNFKKIKGQKYKDITIVCGTNDSATKKSVDKIIVECKHTITAAKTKAERVHISSILPRTDKCVNVTKIDTLNQMLVMLKK